MGCETKKLVTIEFITDYETPMYHSGEVQGAFNENDLLEYIKNYGTNDLLEHLTYLHFQIMTAVRLLNTIKDKGIGDVSAMPLE